MRRHGGIGAEGNRGGVAWASARLEDSKRQCFLVTQPGVACYAAWHREGETPGWREGVHVYRFLGRLPRYGVGT
jgi:hypothetical protein